jgi:hypothetical protein
MRRHCVQLKYSQKNKRPEIGNDANVPNALYKRKEAPIKKLAVPFETLIHKICDNSRRPPQEHQMTARRVRADRPESRLATASEKQKEELLKSN